MSKNISNIAHLLPHSGDMLLVDRVLAYSDSCIITQSIISPNNAFLDGDRFYVFQGMEIMAQSLGALRGLFMKSQSTKLGFVLSVRNMEILKPCVQIDDSLITIATLSLQDEEGFGAYECEMYLKDIKDIKQSQDTLNTLKKQLLPKHLILKANLSVLNPSQAILEQIMENK